MTQPTAFEAFEAAAKAERFDEVLERRWPPAKVLETHTHPFALRALVVEGEMWLTVGDAVRHLHPGDEFALDRDVPHAERHGPEGGRRTGRRAAAASSGRSRTPGRAVASAPLPPRFARREAEGYFGYPTVCARTMR